MKAYAITIEGFHENPFSVRAFVGSLDGAQKLAEEMYWGDDKLRVGQVDVDLSAEIHDEAGQLVAVYSCYGQDDKGYLKRLAFPEWDAK